MTRTIDSTLMLNNGVEMPRFGLGTYKTDAKTEAYDATTWALEAGYRAIDTAALYGNEAEIGQAVKDYRVSRDDVFITSKVWLPDISYEGTLAAFDDTVQKLGIDVLDLYLIHWPVNDWQGSWRACEELYHAGRIRAIGVSNFLQKHLEELLKIAEVAPAINQYEYHPYLQQPELRDFCREQDIAITAWAPLMKGRVLDVPEIVTIGEKYGKNGVQVTLRWMLQTDIITIPKSAKQARIIANAEIFDFELSDDDIAAMNALDRADRQGIHPDEIGR